jgi:uncharacterized protein CbrC (UPF0167 family)
MSAIARGPVQTCRLCGRVEPVRDTGRGFPPDAAKHRLRKWCKADGCPCEPTYTAGFDLATWHRAAQAGGGE